MAVVLIFLIIGLSTGDDLYFKIALPVLVMKMVYPMFYYYFAILWLGFSHILGTFVSKIILSALYFLLVLPVALVRRLMGKDSLKLKQFKKSGGSVMHRRNHRFSAEDIVNPY